MGASDRRLLASWLAEIDDATLTHLLVARGVPPASPWRDAFDAAAGLLDPTAVDRALTRLPRESLRALAEDAGDDRARALGLLRPDGSAFDVVRERVLVARDAVPEAFRDGSADTERLGATPAGTAPTSDAATSAALAERALLAAAALADVVAGAGESPLLRTSSGAAVAADRRRIVEWGAADSPETADDAVAVAVAAGLLDAREREWTPSADAGDWLDEEPLGRWHRVAEALRRMLPDGARTADGGYRPIREWGETYPLDPAWPARAETLRRIAAAWGLVDSDGAEPAWAAPLRRGAPATDAGLGAYVPEGIDRVYLQADLTAIAPGPLKTALDRRLRRVAVRESRAQASSYRFTEASLARAISAGETAESIRAFLGELSLTGIPQPLDYLIERVAGRHGLIRVSARGDLTIVASTDSHLLETLRIDQSLRALGLLGGGDVLVTAVSPDAVAAALHDARYPVLLEEGEPPVGVPAPETPSAPGRHDALVARLQGGAVSVGDAAWLARELDEAVRARARVVVAVRLPDGGTREFTLEATGIGGGRFRGRDRVADVERTLPLTSIAHVHPAP